MPREAAKGNSGKVRRQAVVRPGVAARRPGRGAIFLRRATFLCRSRGRLRRDGGAGFTEFARRAPMRLVGAVAPVARAVERVQAVAHHDLHVADPVRPDISGVIVRRLVDLGQPDLGVERLLGDAVGARPGAALVDRLRLAVAGEGELARQMPVRVLIDHRADVLRIVRREHAVEHDLRHRLLAARRLVARLEIDRLRQALLGLVVVLALQARAAAPATAAASAAADAIITDLGKLHRKLGSAARLACWTGAATGAPASRPASGRRPERPAAARRRSLRSSAWPSAPGRRPASALRTPSARKGADAPRAIVRQRARRQAARSPRRRRGLRIGRDEGIFDRRYRDRRAR